MGCCSCWCRIEAPCCCKETLNWSICFQGRSGAGPYLVMSTININLRRRRRHGGGVGGDGCSCERQRQQEPEPRQQQQQQLAAGRGLPAARRCCLPHGGDALARGHSGRQAGKVASAWEVVQVTAPLS